MIPVEYYLIVSAIMLFAGMYGFFVRRTTLAMLLSIELMLNATDINFAAFNRLVFPAGHEAISLRFSPLPSRRLRALWPSPS